MNYNKLKEKVVLLSIDGKQFILFPRYAGGTVTEAETLLNSATRGKFLPHMRVKEAKSGTAKRTDNFKLVNAYQVTISEVILIDVPKEITDLYKAPADEEEEAKELRLAQIKNYFETN